MCVPRVHPKSALTPITPNRTKKGDSIKMLILHRVMEHSSIFPCTGKVPRAAQEKHQRNQEKPIPYYAETNGNNLLIYADAY